MFDTKEETAIVFVDDCNGLAVIEASDQIKNECREISVYDIFDELEKQPKGVYTVKLDTWFEHGEQHGTCEFVTSVVSHSLNDELTAKFIN